jgi:tetratricopeptide (TPR) repeat protein
MANGGRNFGSHSSRKILEDRPSFFVCVGLAFVTLLVYCRVARFDFTNFDDPYFIYANPMVSNGLTIKGVFWGLTTSYYDWWHPIMWWSHMLDCQLFGLRPGLHHLENLGFHVANTLLVFGLLRRSTGAWKRSAFVAALFALHPVHVESVAWLAERKDVLSTFFFLLCLWTYLDYVQERAAQSSRSSHSYRLTLLLYVLGLMTKPMILTLPFVMLLLDCWPLRRIAAWSPDGRASAAGLPWFTLVMEKVPFFALTIGSCLVTYLGMKAGHNLVSGEEVHWSLRFTNVPVSYTRYLGKIFWPANMAVFYPRPMHWEFWQVAGAVLVLILLSALAIVYMRPAPYFMFGWLLFLGVLVPVIGIIPNGAYSMADRYTYVPSIGIFVACVWGLAEISVRWKHRDAILTAAAALTLVVCSSLTWHQIGFWRNNYTLWDHCVAVTRDNAIAHFQWGWALQSDGREKEAIPHYREALRIQPGFLNANLNLGVALAAAGELREATNYFGKALRIKPGYDKANINLGNALCRLEDFSGATNCYAQVLTVDPNDGSTHRVYALALVELGDFTGAISHANEALRLDPNDFWASVFKGRALSGLGKSGEAMQCYYAALRLKPQCDDAYYRIALEWLKGGRSDEALLALTETLKINPASDDAHFQLGVILAKLRRTGEALAHYREALRLKPDSPETLNNLAWILATAPEAEFRNGAEAAAFARRACELTSSQNPVYLGTLAAACAESGQFEQAVDAAQKACDIASSHGETALLGRDQELVRQFKNHEPYRDGR